MCGISGGLNINKHQLESMLAALIHRGPDELGSWISDSVGLGTNRLVVHGKDEGKQPVENERYVLVFNGEIFNWKELKRNTGDDAIASDTRMLLTYLSSSRDIASSLTKLRGMFSFALYDKKEGVLHLARDSAGIKPLHYYQANGVVRFGSEIKSILASGISTDIDDETLADYAIMGFPLSRSTLFKGISQVLPGEYIKLTSTETYHHRFFDYRALALDEHEDILKKEYLAEELADLILRSLKEQTDTQLIQIMLSGGLDSATLVHATTLLYPSDRIRLTTFSENQDDPDYVSARGISAYYDLPLQIVTPLSEEEFSNQFSSFVHTVEDLCFESFAIWELSRHMACFGKVAFCGQGPDEMFGGYPKHADPKGYLRDIRENYYRYTDLFGTTFRNHALILDALQRIQKGDGIMETTLFDMCQELPNLQLSTYDRVSMAHALELRVPYLDERIIALSAKLPVDLKRNKGRDKVILRDAATILGVPSFITERPKYLGGSQLIPRNISYLKETCMREETVNLNDPYIFALSQGIFTNNNLPVYQCMLRILKNMINKSARFT